jgi:beta-1,3-galactosyltransferase 1
MTELPTDSSQNRPWLAAVICAAADVERRMIIRSTWMSIFKNVPFDGRFVISHPGQWRDIVAKENRTFGDMIVLDWLAEDDITANTIKTLEFYKWLATSGMRYEFVTKMDTDLWLNARLFWDRFLEPNTSNSTTGSLRATIDRTVIGELYFAPSWDLVFPHGAMYTVTWDMVELLAMLQHRFGVVTGEDMAVASLMLKGQETANFINFKGKEKFDYDDRDSRGDGTAWARARTHPNAIKHALVGDSIIAVHNLKSKAHWFKVAACFDKDGLIHQTPPPQTEKTPWSLRWLDFRAIIEWLSDAHRSRFDAIPEFLWSREDNIWVCDGIWRLGKTKTGYLA